MEAADKRLDNLADMKVFCGFWRRAFICAPYDPEADRSWEKRWWYADRIYQAYIADESYLRAAWDAMGNAYITESLGISEEQIRAFRAAVLE